MPKKKARGPVSEGRSFDKIVERVARIVEEKKRQGGRRPLFWPFNHFGTSLEWRGVKNEREVKGMRWPTGLALFLLLLVGVTGCTTTQSAPYQGASLGAAVGAFSGALLDHHNPWRGAVIGATAGAVLGGGLVALSTQASQEAAATGQPRVYRRGSTVVEAYPMEYNQRTRCRKVHKRIWQNGHLVTDRIEEVCRGTKVGNYY